MSNENHRIPSETIERLRRERDELVWADHADGSTTGWEWALGSRYSVLRDYVTDLMDGWFGFPDGALDDDFVIPRAEWSEGFVEGVLDFWVEVEWRLGDV